MEEGDGVSLSNRSMFTRISEGSKQRMASPLEVPCLPDMIYLDPMFPLTKKKSPAAKKDIAMLHFYNYMS